MLGVDLGSGAYFDFCDVDVNKLNARDVLT